LALRRLRIRASYLSSARIIASGTWAAGKVGLGSGPADTAAAIGAEFVGEAGAAAGVVVAWVGSAAAVVVADVLAVSTGRRSGVLNASGWTPTFIGVVATGMRGTTLLLRAGTGKPPVGAVAVVAVGAAAVAVCVACFATAGGRLGVAIDSGLCVVAAVGDRLV
jgi:hypothetical protein